MNSVKNSRKTNLKKGVEQDMPDKILPDVRFGTSFLDKQYKNYAEKGEVIMDKITGEVLLKRKLDGKIKSFVQNDKYLHEMMIELRIMLNNYTQFTYPSENDDAWFTNADFNVVDINRGVRVNALTTSGFTFANTSVNPKNNFEFNVSNECNGFFMRAITRDTDKNLIQYLSSVYDSLYENYSGSEPDYVTEHNKYADGVWETSDIEVAYGIAVTGTLIGQSGSTTRNFSDTAMIASNENSFVEFPANYASAFSTITSIKVSINSITFTKVNKAYSYIEGMGDGFDKTVFDGLIAPDNAIYYENMNISAFVDEPEDIPMNDNVLNICIRDMRNTLDYISIITKLGTNAGYIPSVTRPASDIWSANNVWAELCRRIVGAGVVTDTGSESDLDAIEKHLYSTTGIHTNFTMDESDTNDIYIKDLNKTRATFARQK